MRGGHTCDLLAYESAEKLHTVLEKTKYDAVVSSEAAVLARVSPQDRAQTHTVFLAADFFCSQRMGAAKCDRYLIPQEELSFDFINRGALDRHVRVCGIPVPEKYSRRMTKTDGCSSLGLRAGLPVFLLLADGVSGNEIKATVRAAKALCPATQLLILSTEARIGALQGAFAESENVFVTQSTGNEALGLSVADAVFTAAFSVPVCAAAQRGKNLILLHTASPGARKNAAFLDLHGAAFSGKTAADNVSYACRLLESVRLRGNMNAAQEKYILSDAEKRFVKILEEIADTD